MKSTTECPFCKENNGQLKNESNFLPVLAMLVGVFYLIWWVVSKFDMVLIIWAVVFFVYGYPRLIESGKYDSFECPDCKKGWVLKKPNRFPPPPEPPKDPDEFL